MKIAVLDDYADAFRTVAGFAQLKDHEVAVYRDTVKDPAALAERLRDADVVVLTQERSHLARDVIARLPGLKLIAQTGSHRMHLDIDACTAQGILIAAGGGGKSYSTGEMTWALILASLRHIPLEVQQMKAGKWQTTIGSEIHGKTLGVYGLGKIGSRVAQVGQAFGMKVMCWGREATQARARDAGYEVPASREAFFAQADILTLHIYYDEQTRGIVTAADLAHMKPDALLVNTSRARLIEEGALVAALGRGRPGYAAVDVYEDEPVTGGSHPLLSLPNVICTPHLGYAVREKFADFYGDAIRRIVAFASGNPVDVINPEALAKARRR